jgi:hypothetical protein
MGGDISPPAAAGTEARRLRVWRTLVQPLREANLARVDPAAAFATLATATAAARGDLAARLAALAGWWDDLLTGQDAAYPDAATSANVGAEDEGSDLAGA